MTLQAPKLDDLTWEDLRSLALRKIPVASGGRWTHHAPVDSGVTLLEIFAFLLEQQLFVLDQVPDSLIRAILGLLGEAPRPTGVARTVVAPKPGELRDFVAVPADMKLRPASNALRRLVFTTMEETLLLPVKDRKIDLNGQDLTLALAPQHPSAPPHDIAFKPRSDGSATLTIDVELETPIRSEHAGAQTAIALVLDDPDVPEEWSGDAVNDVPPPVDLQLGWSSGGVQSDLSGWQDGTGGLRRSGLIRFPIPADTGGQDRFQVTLSTDVADFPEPPRLVAIHVGAMISHHRYTRQIQAVDTGDTEHDAIRTDLTGQLDRWLPISGLALVLPEALHEVIENSPELRLERPGGEWYDWHPKGDLTPLDSEDRAFIVDRLKGKLLFGNGYEGRVPAPTTNLSLKLDIGGGIEGNHAAGLEWHPVDPLATGLTLVSVTDASGGHEAESVDEARLRVAASLAERRRAVTEVDFVTLIETTPGVGPHRAYVLAGHDPDFPCIHSPDSITVFVVPKTRPEVVSPRADDGAMAIFRSRLDEARMLTTRVFVARPVFRPLALTVEVSSGVSSATALNELLQPVLSKYLHPTCGGPDEAGWPFGRAPRPSELIRVGQTVLAPDCRIERVAIRLMDDTDEPEDCLEIAIGETELVYLSSLVVNVVIGTTTEATL